MKAGLNFEKFVEGVIHEGLHQRNERDGTDVRSGLGKAEYGKDIIVEIKTKATIIGIPLVNRSTSKLRVAVECKYVGEKSAMSLQNFAANILQNIQGKCDHYILITNGFLTPKASYEFHNQFKGKSQTKVWLVDAPLLQREIQELKLKNLPADIKLHGKKTKKLSQIDDVVCHLEIEPHDDNNKQTSEILVSLRNMSSKPQQGVVRLQSRDGLEPESIEHTFNLDPFGIDSCKFSLKRDLADTHRRIQLGLMVGSTIQPLYDLLPASLQLDLGLPLLGAGHQEACERLASAFNAYAADVQMRAASGKGVPNLLVASITGPTGTGKSHLVRELLNKHDLHPFTSFTYVFGSRADAVEAEYRRSRLTMPSLPNPTTASDVIDAFLNAEALGGSIPLLLLEDTHLADDDTCQKLANIIKGNINTPKAAVILIIGRTDFRFGSSEAARLLMSLKAKASVEEPIPDSSPDVKRPAPVRSHVQVDALDHDGFEAMTCEVLQDATPGTLKVIEQLSGRVPHHVLQCIEWLMDMTALRVKYRPEIGIFNTRLFNERMATLPSDMTTLLTERFNILSEVEHGERAQLIVAAAALLGTKLPATLLSLGLDGTVHEPDDAAEVQLLLRERRLLVQIGDGIGLRWHHENLLTHMRNWLLNWDTPTPLGGGADRKARAPTRTASKNQSDTWARKAAKALIARDDIWAELPPEDQGLIAALAQQHDRAVLSWRAMLTMAEAANGYSTTDLDNRHFPYLRWLYASLAALDPCDQRLPKVAIAMCYLGGYAMSLADGIQAVQWCRNQAIKNQAGNWCEADIYWIDLLEAHFLLDGGYVREAHGKFLRLQAQYHGTSSLQQDARICFELYNCLGMLYGYYNDLRLALASYHIAEEAAERIGDQTLKAKLVGDKAALYQFCDFQQCDKLTLAALHMNQQNGTDRHKKHADLAELLMTTLKSNQWEVAEQRNQVLKQVLAALDNIEEACSSSSYLTFMPRVDLLRATLCYLLATDCTRSPKHDPDLMDMADQIAVRGLDVGLQRGIGFTSWQLVNLRAMIAARREDTNKAIKMLRQARQMLHADGLLFLGYADLTCPNQIVLANLVKMLLLAEADVDIKSLLSGVSTYDLKDLTTEDWLKYALATSKDFHALMWPPPRRQNKKGTGPVPGKDGIGTGLILDECLDPPLGLIVWF